MRSMIGRQDDGDRVLFVNMESIVTQDAQSSVNIGQQ